MGDENEFTVTVLSTLIDYNPSASTELVNPPSSKFVLTISAPAPFDESTLAGLSEALNSQQKGGNKSIKGVKSNQQAPYF